MASGAVEEAAALAAEAGKAMPLADSTKVKDIHKEDGGDGWMDMGMDMGASSVSVPCLKGWT